MKLRRERPTVRLKPSGKKGHISLGFLKRENNRISRKIGLGKIIESFGENDKFEQEKYRKQNKSKMQDEKVFY